MLHCTVHSPGERRFLLASVANQSLFYLYRTMKQEIKSISVPTRTLHNVAEYNTLDLCSHLSVIECKLPKKGHVLARWELYLCLHACMDENVCTSCPYYPSCSMFFFAMVVLTVGCPVNPQLSSFTVQAVVGLLSLCGLSVVSSLLTQDLPKWVFSPVSCLKPTSTHTNILSRAHMWTCMHVTYGMWRNLVLWLGH